MRIFLAEILEGNPVNYMFIPTQRRPLNIDRDIEIALAVHNAYKEIPRLRSSRAGNGATTEIANQFCLSEDEVLTIYSRANKELDLEETATTGAICFKE